MNFREKNRSLLRGRIAGDTFDGVVQQSFEAMTAAAQEGK
jgi:hypothetical protein